MLQTYICYFFAAQHCGYFMSSFPDSKDIIDVFKEIHADVMERHVYTWQGIIEHRKGISRLNTLNNSSNQAYSESEITVSRETQPHENGTLLTVEYDIPGYRLTSEFLYTEESPYIPFPVKPLIRTVEDLEAFTYIKKRERYIPNYSYFLKEDQRIGDAGIATDTGLTSPIQELIQVVIGIEKFYTEFYLNHLEKLEKLLRIMHEKNLECYEIIADSPAEVVINYENTSTTLVSPDIYKTYSHGCIDDYADVLHRKDKIYLTHRCGLLKNLMGLIKKGKDDGIVDISPEPTGDVTLLEAREALPGKIVMGGIDPTFLTQWSAEQIGDYVKDIISRVGSGARIILGTADATPKDAKMENLTTIGKIVCIG